MLCASWRQEYGDRNWSNRLQSARDARWDDDGRSNRPTLTHRFYHSAIFHPITPYNVWFFWVSRHRSIILAKNWNIFGQILRNSRKCAKTWMIENVSWSQKRLGFLLSSLWKVFLKFFLQVNPIPIRTNSDKASVHRAFSRLKRKTRTYFRRFFRLGASFRPHSCAIFHPNTHIIFFARYRHMINDDLRKKITTFSGKAYGI